MTFLIIKELLKENFFFNGTVYLEKQIKDPGKRKRAKLGLDDERNEKVSALAGEFNFFDEINSKKRNNVLFKSKIAKEYLEVQDFVNTNFESEKFFKSEKERLATEYLKGDLFVFINKTNLGTTLVCDLELNSLIVTPLVSNVGEGMIVNKQMLEFLEDLIKKSGGDLDE